MQKRLIGILLALAMVITFGLIVRAAAAEDAAIVVQLTNEERAKAGKPALSAGNSKLDQAAQKRAEEIAESFSHTRPDGSECFTALDDYGVTNTAAGENIAWGSGTLGTPGAIVNSWMNSPGHRTNILDLNDRGFNQIGVGVVQSGDNTYYVQLFVKTTMAPDVTDPTSPAMTAAAPPTTTAAPVTTTAAPVTTTAAPVTTTAAPVTTTAAPVTTTAAPMPGQNPGRQRPMVRSGPFGGLLWFLDMIFFGWIWIFFGWI